MENRISLGRKVEIRETEKNRFFTGYAAVFYREGDQETEYRLGRDYVERITKSAFNRAIREKHDARGLYNHDSGVLLGRVSNGTCNLTVDDVGLRFEILFDESDADHQRVKAKIDRGDLSGSSFAFSNASEEWEETRENGQVVYIRNLTDLDLHDVGPVTYPAYSGTDAGVRCAVGTESEFIEARSALGNYKNAIKSHVQGKIDVEYQYRKMIIDGDFEIATVDVKPKNG